MPKGIPTTLDGWKVRIRNLPQFSHLSEEEKDRVAQERFEAYEQGIVQPTRAHKKRDLDDLMEADRVFKKKFSKIWRSIYRDIDGPPVVREHLAKQTAMAFLLAERKMAEEYDRGSVGEGAAAINYLSQVATRYAESLEVSPKHRKPGKGKDERLTDLLAAAEKGQKMLKRSAELEEEDDRILSPDD